MLNAVRGPTRVLLVRHGRTSANARGLLSGRHDVALDPEGRLQAEAVAAAISVRVGGSPVTVVSSPLERAVDTATAILRTCDRAGGTTADQAGGGGPLVDDRFIELDYGEWDGIALTEVPPEAWSRWRSDPGFAPPGGETLGSVSVRVAEALQDWSGRLQGETLVVASHVSPIKAAVTWAMGVGDSVTWRLRLSNASICELLVDSDPEGRPRPTLVGFNDTAHLVGPE